MIRADDWLYHAWLLLVTASASGGEESSQITMPRAISAAYYCLFHSLTSAGAKAVSSGNTGLEVQVARVFNHAAMRKVCDAYVRSPTNPFPVELAHSNRSPPPARLIQVARTFYILQEGRYTADYDLYSSFQFEGALQAVRQAQEATSALKELQTVPETAVFLTALLLADRWTRRG